MKFDEIKAHEKELIRMGEESEAYLKQMPNDDDYLYFRKLFYQRLVRTVSFCLLSIFFIVLANVITITRPLGSPYLTTQDGLIIKINDYTSVKR
jgi:hypothetical protein